MKWKNLGNRFNVRIAKEQLHIFSSQGKSFALLIIFIFAGVTAPVNFTSVGCAELLLKKLALH
jgi:hypothetical protein